MKKQLILLVTLAALAFGCKTGREQPDSADPLHNSQNALDWSGRYTGVLPCADCAGIRTVLTLNQDLTYTQEAQYLGKGQEVYKDSGSFAWDKTGSRIVLSSDSISTAPEAYKVEENALVRLDRSGKRIQGALAEKYVLKKAGTETDIMATHWKLVALNGQQLARQANQQRDPHFVLQPDGNSVTGYTGCNSFVGTYALSGSNGIRFSKMASTRMACLQMTHENAYLQVMETADSFSLKGDTLTLQTAGGASLAKFVAADLN
ncbi:copper resistance protein NlpE N-terminal domain-containing protein [Pontibacter sp. E15-1]|uniref:copper resistance protein NlpE N-terminal domain-containing protein n=1 Tax=Pontibacter sp. E15-1 TaxID=2919918 RepID=UPI001F4F80A7|nr:copper resistance protein NlpE N-terminal domain-containing protein [Pontibacter sp. E15-1]MCJ8165215.1 copper resistance protein NlpE N-terminal domain-containing protein [Pontibacter sp. E15-1]